MIRVFLDDLPSLFLGMKPAHPELVGNRGIALIVGRITGVERDLHAAASLFGEAVLLMARRLGVDKIPRGLTGQKADQIDEARIGLGVCHTRGVDFRRFDGQMQSLRCGLPLSCQECAIRFLRVEVRKGQDDMLVQSIKEKSHVKTACCLFSRRGASCSVAETDSASS